METKHPVSAWIEADPARSQVKLAGAVECSEPHLSLVLQRKRGVSMKLAQKLSVATGVPIEAFLLDEPTGADQ